MNWLQWSLSGFPKRRRWARVIGETLHATPYSRVYSWLHAHQLRVWNSDFWVHEKDCSQFPRSIISMKVKQKIPSKSLTSQILYEDWPMMISIYSHFQLKHVFLANSVYFRNGLDNTKTYFKTTIVDTLSLLHLIGLVFTGKQHWLSSYIFVLFFSYRLVVHIKVAWHPTQVVRALDLEVFSALLTMYGKPFFHLADVVTAIRSERAILPSFIHWL